MRLDWVENVLLTPFAQIQQQVADQLTGAHTDLLYFNASCSGGDPMALCAGAILAYPATWGARFRAAALGLLAITLLNVVRIGHLSLVAADNSLFQLLHIYVWPGILILATAAYVFAWMNREGRAAPAGGSASRIALSAAARRGGSWCSRSCSSWRTSPLRRSSTRARSSTSSHAGSRRPAAPSWSRRERR